MAYTYHALMICPCVLQSSSDSPMSKNNFLSSALELGQYLHVTWNSWAILISYVFCTQHFALESTNTTSLFCPTVSVYFTGTVAHTWLTANFGPLRPLHLSQGNSRI